MSEFRVTGNLGHTSKPILVNQSGFTYLGALVLIVVAGILITGVSKYWSTIAKREREKELFFRGDQIRRAIASYYNNAPSGRSSYYPRRLKDLIKDPRFLGVRRHLRKLYKDPMSQKGEWGLILAKRGGIKGVFSKSKEQPLKVGEFPLGYEDFEKAKGYSDWKFIYEPKPVKASKAK